MINKNLFNTLIVSNNKFSTLEIKMIVSEIMEINQIISIKIDVDTETNILKYKPTLIIVDVENKENEILNILNNTIGNYKYIIFITSNENIEDLNIVNQNIYIVNKLINLSSIKEKIQKIYNNHQLEFSVKKVSNKLKINNNKIFLPYNKVWQSINLSDLLYLKGSGPYTIIYTKTNEYKLSKNLGELCKELQPYLQFERIHKSYVVNTNLIIGIRKGLKSFILLENNIQVPISNNLKATFFKKLNL